MHKFDENDVTIQHERLADRSGFLRLIHRPSGLFVEAHLTSQPVLKVKRGLMDALIRKVLTQDGALCEGDIANDPSTSREGDIARSLA
jgi:hypothetical protein